MSSTTQNLSCKTNCKTFFFLIVNTCNQWVDWNMHSRCLDFFLLSFGWGVRDFFHFSFVPNMFPSRSQMGSQCVFQGCSQIAPHFNPISLGQSPPLFTYVGRPKGEALHLSIESFILGEPPWFQLFNAMGQSK